jgi:hypothetical protein
MNIETDSEREKREFEEYTAKYCTPSICEDCNMCKHCNECECVPMTEEEKKEIIGLLLKMKDNMPDPDELPDGYWDFDDETEAMIAEAASRLHRQLYGDDEQ